MKKLQFLTSLLLLVIFGVKMAPGQEIPDLSDLDSSQLENIALDFPINFAKLKKNFCEQINGEERNDSCFKQLKIICGNETFLDLMFDASSKFPYSGMLVKTRLDLGSYSECINLDLTVNNTRVLGKHCTAGLIVPTIILPDDLYNFNETYRLSTCIPDQCTAKYLLSLANMSSAYPLFNDNICSTKDTIKDLHWDAYLVIICICLIFLVMSATTTCDLYFYYTNREDRTHIAVQAFSIFRNGKKLFKTFKHTSGDQIQVIHGLRVISMMWIVVGHTFFFLTDYPSMDANFIENFEWTWNSFYLSTAHLAVDTFFFLSGFLMAYQYLKQNPQSFDGHIKRIPFMVLHRYLRLTPSMAAAYFIVVSLGRHLGNGPLFFLKAAEEKDKCLKYWWTFFTYLQNYVNYNDICLINTWYLSADWQLFLISPLIMIPVAMLVKNNFKWVMWQLLILNILLTLVPMTIKFAIEDYANGYETHTRLNDYFIGFMLGVYMREKRALKQRFSNKVTVILWGVAICTMVAVAVVMKAIQLKIHFTEDISYMPYIILVRAAWCSALAWVVYACHHGYGGCINWFLTSSLTSVLSRLTYSIFIVHCIVIFCLKMTSEQLAEAGQMTGVKDSIVIYIASVLLSIFWSLAFESPMIILENHFIRKKSR
ncbi:nose resistant to fluoxetine protein 6-like [Euwallacea fornicatus]|uniref:nose resistant to fluoxetine protein 6-like n=1 Tax=Euwallacea fornicatus TaxID=995702 RepID=UPI00338FF312